MGQAATMLHHLPLPDMVSPRLRLAAFLAILFLACPMGLIAATAKSPKLPRRAPVPQLQERPADPPPGVVPVPAAKPGEADFPKPKEAVKPNAAETTLPQLTPENPGAVPLPPQKPAKATTDAKEPMKPSETKPEKKPIPPDPRSTIIPLNPMPDEEVACRTRLKALGVEFEEHEAERDAEIGCSIPYPIVLKTLGGGINLEPKAELNCTMAQAAARFMSTSVAPAVKSQFNADVKTVSQASAYVCRPRHNGRKMSEHAFGNALDIASFTLTDGTKVDIEPVPPQKNASFLSKIRKAACGPFKTVLGPGSDPDHSLHFHIDLEPRRNGGTFCQ
ncbi:MAG TPA: extensin family protein [Mesorhizobium sp.]